MSFIQSVTSALTTARSSPSGRRTILLGSITVAIYLIYEKIHLPPPSLRHIPHLNFFMLFNALLKRKPIEQVVREIYKSNALKSSHNGLYLRLDNSGWSVRLTRPIDVKFVLTRKELFPKSKVVALNRRGTLIGRVLRVANLSDLDDDEWKRQSKVIHPVIRRAMPIKVFASLSQKAIDVIEADRPIDVYNLMHRWAMDIMGKALFGYNFGTLDDRNSEWIVRFRRIMRIGQNPVFFMMPFVERNFKHWFPELEKGHQEMTIYADMINGIVRQRREAILNGEMEKVDDHEKDLLTSMIEASMDEQVPFTDEDFQSNILSLFTVGNESTSSAMAYTLYYLAVNKEIQQRAREEAFHVLGDGCDTHPTLQEVQKLAYITMIIKESLRLSASLTHLSNRVTSRDTEISGTFIPKGTQVGFAFPDIHRNPNTWKNPDIFDPERFVPGGEADQLDGLPWTPFANGGARVCPAMRSTMIKEAIFLSMLLRKYSFYLPEHSIHKNGLVNDGFMVLQPKTLK